MATKPRHNTTITGSIAFHKSTEGVYALDLGGSCGDDLFACVNGVLHNMSHSAEWWAGRHSFYIAGDDGKYYVYAHCSSRIAEGRVQEGQVVGKEGSEGNSSGCHLHFSVCDTLGQVAYGGNTKRDITTSFWHNAAEPSGTPLPPTPTSNGHGSGNVHHGNYTPKPVGDVIELRPQHIVFRKGNADVYEISLNMVNIVGEKITIIESNFARWAFKYDNIILKNKYGSWLHWVHEATTQNVAKDSPININWELELKNTSPTHSLLGKDGEPAKLMGYFFGNAQSSLKAELHKDSGWTKNGNTLSGNVKTTNNQLKHNENLFTKKEIQSTNNISYIPTLFSSEI